MKQYNNLIFDVNEDIRKGKNYIWGVGNHATHMSKWFESNGIPYEGFVHASDNKSVPEGKKVITLEEFNDLGDANLLLTQNRWQEVYDRLWNEVDWRRIYVNTTWYRGEARCIMCDNEVTFSPDAEFVPFLAERMFGGGRIPETQVIHCPRCRCYYSLYRPTDEEMAALYSGYRGEAYFQQRSRYEPEYTRELNHELGVPADGGKERKGRIFDFVKPYIDHRHVKTVLDYGGDEGQFIPDEFADVDRYVFEISGNRVMDGITLINEKERLTEFDWDLIFCNHTFEHLSEPRKCFKELVSYMSEQTLLYIELPFENHMENSDFVPVHEHINFFREDVFRFWAEENNLKILKMNTDKVIQVLLGR